MDKTQKMFQALGNAISASKSELLNEFTKTNGRLDKLEKSLKGFRLETSNNFKHVNARIDKIGLAVARLEDDTPTIEEFDKLESRVTKVEEKVASI